MPKTPWFQPLRNFARRRGWDIVRTETVNPYHLREFYLDRFRTETVLNGITLVLDVGAARGAYAKMLRDAGYRGRIACFEPQKAQTERIREAFASDPGVTVFNCALGAVCSTLELHVSDNRDSSSLLKVSSISLEAEPATRQSGSETVEVKTLDSLLAEISRPEDRVWMKIDVQGFEREVLSGAVEAVRAAEFIEVELSIATVYEGQPLLGEVVSMLRDMGHELTILGNPWCSPKTGQILQMDGVFRRA